MRGRDLIGRTIGNYTVVRRLGSGGMGEVFEAQQPAIGARVAIKVLNADATDPASAQRFLIEAQAVNRIQHDGVVKIQDAGYTDDDRPYLVMEFLDGASLAEVMRGERRLPMGSACKVVADVLAVLASAHDEDIVHRDLKPHNVFLTRSGRTVVLDFGVAKLLDTSASVSLTLTGAILGTPAYMAPEQIQGEAIDGRADLYAVGVVLYELVTGRRPFDGDHTFDLLAAHVERRPPPPRAIRPDVPEAVQAVLMSALAKDPDDRFQTAEAMRAALLQAIAGLGAEAFAPIQLPGVAVRRTPTVPPALDSGAPTAPRLARADRESGPSRALGAGADPTVRGKASGGARTELGVASTAASPRVDAAGDTDDADASRARPGESPPPGTSSLVPRSRKPALIVAIALGLGAIAAAFAIGRVVGKRDTPPAAPLAGTGAVGAAALDAAPEPPADAAEPPRSLPPEVARRLFARRLHVSDLRPEVVDFLRTAEVPGSAAAAQVPAMLAEILTEVDRVVIDMDLVAAKALRVQALSEALATTMPASASQKIGDALARVQIALDKGDAVGANDHLWRVEWMLEHGGKAP